MVKKGDEERWRRLDDEFKQLSLKQNRTLAEERRWEQVYAEKERLKSGGGGSEGGAGVGMMTGLAAGGARGAAPQTDPKTLKTLGNFFAGFALLLWVIDIVPLPILGDVYSGFNFNPQDFWNNWFSEFTFGNVWFDALIVLVAFFIIIKYAREQRMPSGFEIFVIFLFSFTMIFFLANPGWMAFPKAILHFIFIILFGFMYMGRLTNTNTAFLSVSGLLFFDFFLFSTALNTIPVLKYMSLLSTLVIALTFGFTPSVFTGIVTAFLVVFIVAVSVAEGYIGQGVSFEEGGGDKPALAQIWDRFTGGIGKYGGQIQKTLESRIQYAITGKVEENEFEPLGVYLENVQSADKKYYEDEKVVVWGSVIARTLDDPINIKVGCFAGDRKDKKFADKVDPDKKFSVFTLEEQDFACTFGSCKDADLGEDLRCKKFCDPQKEKNLGCKTAVEREILKIGRNTIKTFADFNFETLAYLKVYFINRERQRAMVREGLDPFEEFAIDDKNPVAVYTNGPTKIEMGTNSPLVSVSNDYIVEPSLDIRIGNREGWQGRINNLKELVLFLPEGIGFDPQQSCVNKKFLPYDINNCKGNCTEFVEKECTEVCNGYTDTGEKKKCNDACSERKKVCEESCSSFFAEGGQSYEGYALDVKDITYRDEATDFEKGKLFRCRFKPDPNAVLGPSPFTTKSFRVKVRYNYTVEKDAIAEIAELPEELKDTSVKPLTNLVISYDETKSIVTLEWTLSADDGSGEKDVVGYNIYRKEEGNDYISLIEAGKILREGTNKYEDAFTPNAETKYFYKVGVVDNNKNAAFAEKEFIYRP